MDDYFSPVNVLADQTVNPLTDYLHFGVPPIICQAFPLKGVLDRSFFKFFYSSSLAGLPFQLNWWSHAIYVG
jgi:hypothetical protein